jgi:hypothetical protein
VFIPSLLKPHLENPRDKKFKLRGRKRSGRG